MPHGDIQPRTVHINKSGEVSLANNAFLVQKQTGYLKMIHSNLKYKSPLSPELLKNLKPMRQAPVYDKLASDIWSLGITIMCACTNERYEKFYDFPKCKIRYDLLTKNLNRMEDIGYSDQLVQLIREMLKENEVQRLKLPRAKEFARMIKEMRNYKGKEEEGLEPISRERGIESPVNGIRSMRRNSGLSSRSRSPIRNASFASKEKLAKTKNGTVKDDFTPERSYFCENNELKNKKTSWYNKENLNSHNQSINSRGDPFAMRMKSTSGKVKKGIKFEYGESTSAPVDGPANFGMNETENDQKMKANQMFNFFEQNNVRTEKKRGQSTNQKKHQTGRPQTPNGPSSPFQHQPQHPSPQNTTPQPLLNLQTNNPFIAQKSTLPPPKPQPYNQNINQPFPPQNGQNPRNLSSYTHSRSTSPVQHQTAHQQLMQHQQIFGSFAPQQVHQHPIQKPISTPMVQQRSRTPSPIQNGQNRQNLVGNCQNYGINGQNRLVCGQNNYSPNYRNWRLNSPINGPNPARGVPYGVYSGSVSPQNLHHQIPSQLISSPLPRSPIGFGNADTPKMNRSPSNIVRINSNKKQPIHNALNHRIDTVPISNKKISRSPSIHENNNPAAVNNASRSHSPYQRSRSYSPVNLSNIKYPNKSLKVFSNLRKNGQNSTSQSPIQSSRVIKSVVTAHNTTNHPLSSRSISNLQDKPQSGQKGHQSNIFRNPSPIHQRTQSHQINHDYDWHSGLSSKIRVKQPVITNSSNSNSKKSKILHNTVVSNRSISNSRNSSRRIISKPLTTHTFNQSQNLKSSKNQKIGLSRNPNTQSNLGFHQHQNNFKSTPVMQTLQQPIESTLGQNTELQKQFFEMKSTPKRSSTHFKSSFLTLNSNLGQSDSIYRPPTPRTQKRYQEAISILTHPQGHQNNDQNSKKNHENFFVKNQPKSKPVLPARHKHNRTKSDYAPVTFNDNKIPHRIQEEEAENEQNSSQTNLRSIIELSKENQFSRENQKNQFSRENQNGQFSSGNQNGQFSGQKR